jgi:hypothetical protein
VNRKRVQTLCKVLRSSNIELETRSNNLCCLMTKGCACLKVLVSNHLKGTAPFHLYTCARMKALCSHEQSYCIFHAPTFIRTMSFAHYIYCGKLPFKSLICKFTVYHTLNITESTSPKLFESEIQEILASALSGQICFASFTICRVVATRKVPVHLTTTGIP